MTSYIGQTKKLTATFTGVSGAAVNPTGITLKIGRQSGATFTLLETKTIADLTYVSTGIYTYLYTPTSGGRYWYEFTSTGTPPTSATRGWFEVADAIF